MMATESFAPSDPVLKALLEQRPVVAIVGASIHPERPSHQIMAGLIEQGYDVIPVHPEYLEVLGRRAYPDLAAIPRHVELVDVFRRADATPGIARQAVAAGAGVLWLQTGVINAEAGRIAAAAGLVVVMDRCLEVEHHRLIGHRFPAPPTGGG
jgi:predicted CoA-binding protein